MLAAGSQVVSTPARMGRLFALALNVFALLTVALVCIDLCLELMLALDLLFTDLATICRAVSSRSN